MFIKMPRQDGARLFIISTKVTSECMKEPYPGCEDRVYPRQKMQKSIQSLLVFPCVSEHIALLQNISLSEPAHTNRGYILINFHDPYGADELFTLRSFTAGNHTKYAQDQTIHNTLIRTDIDESVIRIVLSDLDDSAVRRRIQQVDTVGWTSSRGAAIRFIGPKFEL